MRLEIVSPDGLLFGGEVERVSLPGLSGVFDVLPRHAPMIAALGPGTIRYEEGHKRYEESIQGGFIEVRDDRLAVCVE